MERNACGKLMLSAVVVPGHCQWIMVSWYWIPSEEASAEDPGLYVVEATYTLIEVTP